MTLPGDNTTGIQVTTKIFPLAVLLLLFKTNVTIDGVTSVQPWGSHFFSVPAGTHDVTVSFRYLFSQATGQSRITVEVDPGRITNVKYRSPFLVFLGGSMKVEPPSSSV
jgi:hypothetical protein